MTKGFTSKIRILSHNHLLRMAFVIFLIAIIGLSVVENYGISWDEPLYIKHVLWNYELIRDGKPLPSNPDNIKYYGLVLDTIAEILYQLKVGLGTNIEVTLDRLIFKHYLTFLFSLIAYISVAGIVWILGGLRFAWLGSICLALIPRFWGHSFFNPKDLPFASLFILSTWAGTYIVDQYVQASKLVRLGINRITLSTLLFGGLIGLLTSARTGGFVFLGFIPIAILIVRVGQDKITKVFIQNILICCGLTFVPWAITTTLFHPASWPNSASWFLENIQYNSKHGWGGTVLFDGEFISGNQLPWFYLPRWIMITLPEVTQTLFLLGLIISMLKYRKFSVLQQGSFVLISLQIFALPLYAILRQSIIYDGMRQFLFVLPGIAVIATYGFIWLYQLFNTNWAKFLMVGILGSLFIKVSFDMAALHPYEYVYFNRLSGGLKVANGQYETDYWGLSIREAVEWLNRNSPSESVILVAGPIDSARVSARADLKVVSALDSRAEVISELPERPYYYLAVPKWDYQSTLPECPTIYQARKQAVTLTTVQKCANLQVD